MKKTVTFISLLTLLCAFSVEAGEPHPNFYNRSLNCRLESLDGVKGRGVLQTQGPNKLRLRFQHESLRISYSGEADLNQEVSLDSSVRGLRMSGRDTAFSGPVEFFFAELTTHAEIMILRHSAGPRTQVLKFICER